MRITVTDVRDENKSSLFAKLCMVGSFGRDLLVSMAFIVKHGEDIAGTLTEGDGSAEDFARAMGQLTDDEKVVRFAREAFLAAEESGVSLPHTLSVVQKNGQAPQILAAIVESYGKGYDRDIASMENVTDLVASVLSAEEGQTVLDLGPNSQLLLSRFSPFFGMDGCLLSPRAKEASSFYRLLGREYESRQAILAKMTLDAFGLDAQIDTVAAFEKKLKADRVFVHPGFNCWMTAEEMGKAAGFLSDELWLLPDGKSKAAEWVYALEAIASLEPGGKAVAIMSPGTMFRGGYEEEVRLELLKRGMIQAVVTLPKGLIPGTMVSPVMYVFGRHDGGVRMVDATDVFTKNRRSVVLSDQQVGQILEMLSCDGPNSKVIPVSELAKADFDLSPQKYLLEDDSEGVPLEELAVFVGRGANVSQAELEEKSVPHATAFQHLMIQNVEDGMVQEPLTNLSALPGKGLEKSCLKDGDLVMSAIGPNYKTAVVWVPDEGTILAAGNLYILRFDSEKVDPYYVQAYLCSKPGKKKLAALTKGNAIPRLSIKDLKALRVPICPIEEQWAIGERFRQMLEGVDEAKYELNSLRRRMESLF